MVILTSEAHKIPLVEVRVVVRAGSFYDPAGKEGLANLTNELLVRGTKNHSGDALAEMIEAVGGELTPFTSEGFAGFYARVLSKDLPMLLELINDCLRFPNFDSLEFARMSKKITAQVKANMDDPEYRGELEFIKRLFQNFPLNHFPEEDPAGIKNVTIGDVREFHAKYYVPANTFIIFVGDFEPGALNTILTANYSSWENKDSTFPSVPGQPVLTKKSGVIVKRDISQAYIFLGFPGLDYSAKDWVPARLMNYILGGGGLLARIPAEIRDKRGLAYDARSYFSRYWHGGYFVASVQTKKESASEVVNILVEEMTKMKQGAKSDELDGAKKYYTGHFPLTFDTCREIAGFIMQIETENLGLDYSKRFEGMVSGVTLDQVRRAAEYYLHPEAFVIVGNLIPDDIKQDGIEWIGIRDDLD